MALLSLLETLLPLARERTWRRRHLLPNLALVALTLGLNFALNAGAVLVSAWLGSRGFGLLAGGALPPLALVGDRHRRARRLHLGLSSARCTRCRRSGAFIASTTRTRSWT